MDNKHLPLILFFSVCLIWGTTWMAMEVAVATIPPIFATGLRFLIAAPILIVIARCLKQPLLFPENTTKMDATGSYLLFCHPVYSDDFR